MTSWFYLIGMLPSMFTVWYAKLNWRYIYWAITTSLLIPIEWLVLHTWSIQTTRVFWCRNRWRQRRIGSRGSHQWRSRGSTRMLAITAMAMSTTLCLARNAWFDTDSVQIGIDNRMSGCILFSKDDFCDDLRPCNKVIKGYHGSKQHPL